MIVIQMREMICYATGGEVYIAAQMHTIVRKKKWGSCVHKIHTINHKRQPMLNKVNKCAAHKWQKFEKS